MDLPAAAGPCRFPGRCRRRDLDDRCLGAGPFGRTGAHRSWLWQLPSLRAWARQLSAQPRATWTAGSSDRDLQTLRPWPQSARSGVVGQRPLFHLAQLDQVPVRVSKKTPNLSTPVIGRSQKLGASLLQGFVGCVAVVHPERHGVAHSVWFGRWGEGDHWLVGCRLTPGYEQNPRSTESEHDARFVLSVHLSAKNLGPEGSRSLSVSHDQDLSDLDTRKWVVSRDSVVHHDYRFALCGCRSVQTVHSPCRTGRPRRYCSVPAAAPLSPNTGEC